MSAAPFHAPCFSFSVQLWTYNCKGLSAVWRGRSIPYLLYTIQLLTLSGVTSAFHSSMMQWAQRQLLHNHCSRSQAGAEAPASVCSAARVFLQNCYVASGSLIYT